MNENQLLENVLRLLAGARFDAKGAELMQIANIIHEFSEYAKAKGDSVVGEQ